jgi:peptidyl-prolyl cis-trans isomerase A (cyclophilin A)
MNALIETSLGIIKIKLLPENTPLTVANFVELSEGAKEFIDPYTGKKQQRSFMTV